MSWEKEQVPDRAANSLSHKAQERSLDSFRTAESGLKKLSVESSEFNAIEIEGGVLTPARSPS